MLCFKYYVYPNLMKREGVIFGYEPVYMSSMVLQWHGYYHIYKLVIFTPLRMMIHAVNRYNISMCDCSKDEHCDSDWRLLLECLAEYYH